MVLWTCRKDTPRQISRLQHIYCFRIKSLFPEITIPDNWELYAHERLQKVGVCFDIREQVTTTLLLNIFLNALIPITCFIQNSNKKFSIRKIVFMKNYWFCSNKIYFLNIILLSKIYFFVIQQICKSVTKM